MITPWVADVKLWAFLARSTKGEGGLLHQLSERAIGCHGVPACFEHHQAPWTPPDCIQDNS